MYASPTPKPTDTATAIAWATLRAATHYTRHRKRLTAGAYAADGAGELRALPESHPHALLLWRENIGWTASAQASGVSRDLLDLYLPLCNAGAQSPMTVGHLGQSLDGYIATHSGESFYVTGPENILHLHRMRALCDAVVVGAETVAADNPRLTTRLVPGDSPTRVVLDPKARLSPSHTVFTDTSTPTLVVHASGTGANPTPTPDHAEILNVPVRDNQLDLESLLVSLRQRGMYGVFIEGGGITISRFLESGLLNRIQVAVAPLVIGSGRPGVQLGGDTRLKDCLRPGAQLYRMGADMLFDLDLRQTGVRTHAGGDDDLVRVF